jgi:type II secretory ATPase GspE/PulE/Tfp pilus assembly ATPase PilB-like protein
VVQLVNKIILDAYNRNGRLDIHIEPYPGKQNTQVRIRVDGSCTVYQTIPFSYKNAVVSSLKIMSDLDIAERRSPRTAKSSSKNMAARTSSFASPPYRPRAAWKMWSCVSWRPENPSRWTRWDSPKATTRILSAWSPNLTGMIFVCGPTGSGKTTTLHSALSFINKTETKIWTAEDPVEITQRGLRQVQVKSKIGFDFAAAMRAFLRADPDVIMVGEMRDKETTSIGIEASLTGHLVFSTLHTNSAPESITRLLDMGMDPFNFADAILAILAQRLVRTSARTCKKVRITPAKKSMSELVREYGEDDFKNNVEHSLFSDDLELYKPEGCDLCSNTGYRGRMGIHELLMGTDEMKKLIQLKAPNGRDARPIRCRRHDDAEAGWHRQDLPGTL